MKRRDMFANMIWWKAPNVDVGGSLDGLYAAQGESVQTPAYAPPPPPVESVPLVHEPVTPAPYVDAA